jgi:hypothetical protein
MYASARQLRFLRRCEETTKPCHSERSEESVLVCFQRDKCRFFASLRVTDDSFTAPDPKVLGDRLLSDAKGQLRLERRRIGMKQDAVQAFAPGAA